MTFRKLIPVFIASIVLGSSALAADPMAPELAQGTWAAGKPTTIAAQKGKVTILTFWTTNCINCQRTLPFWNTWTKRYSVSKDVSVISIHTPETQWERNPVNVRRAAERNGLVFPILIDNEGRNWNAYGVQAWPTTILIDKQGRIRNRWEGELDYNGSGAYHDVDARIEALRQEKPGSEGKEQG